MHFFINIGMTMGLMPVIGIPLPFISSGGSSLLGFSLLVGVLLSMDSSWMRQRRALRAPFVRPWDALSGDRTALCSAAGTSKGVRSFSRQTFNNGAEKGWKEERVVRYADCSLQ